MSVNLKMDHFRTCRIWDIWLDPEKETIEEFIEKVTTKPFDIILQNERTSLFHPGVLVRFERYKYAASFFRRIQRMAEIKVEPCNQVFVSCTADVSRWLRCVSDILRHFAEQLNGKITGSYLMQFEGDISVLPELERTMLSLFNTRHGSQLNGKNGSLENVVWLCNVPISATAEEVEQLVINSCGRSAKVYRNSYDNEALAVFDTKEEAEKLTKMKLYWPKMNHHRLTMKTCTQEIFTVTKAACAEWMLADYSKVCSMAKTVNVEPDYIFKSTYTGSYAELIQFERLVRLQYIDEVEKSSTDSKLESSGNDMASGEIPIDVQVKGIGGKTRTDNTSEFPGSSFNTQDYKHTMPETAKYTGSFLPRDSHTRPSCFGVTGDNLQTIGGETVDVNTSPPIQTNDEGRVKTDRTLSQSGGDLTDTPSFHQDSETETTESGRVEIRMEEDILTFMLKVNKKKIKSIETSNGVNVRQKKDICVITIITDHGEVKKASEEIKALYKTVKDSACTMNMKKSTITIAAFGDILERVNNEHSNVFVKNNLNDFEVIVYGEKEHVDPAIDKLKKYIREEGEKYRKPEVTSNDEASEFSSGDATSTSEVPKWFTASWPQIPEVSPTSRSHSSKHSTDPAMAKLKTYSDEEEVKRITLSEARDDKETHEPRDPRTTIAAPSSTPTDDTKISSTPRTHSSTYSTGHTSDISRMSRSERSPLKRSQSVDEEAHSYLQKGSYDFVTNEGLSVVIKHGDITQENADVIVNAADDRLEHGGGVAKALVQAGGRDIQRQSREWVKRHGKLDVSDVAVTRAGQLKAQYIIHAYGPVWDSHGSENRCIHLLTKTILNVLNQANSLNARSIAIPAISSGVYGMPKDKCAKAMCDALHKFSAETGRAGGSYLKKIAFVNIESDTVRAFILEFFTRNVTKAYGNRDTGGPHTAGPLSGDVYDVSTTNHTRGAHGMSRVPVTTSGQDLSGIDQRGSMDTQWMHLPTGGRSAATHLTTTASTTRTTHPGASFGSNSQTHPIGSPSSGALSQPPTPQPLSSLHSILRDGGMGDCEICADDTVPLKKLICCDYKICATCAGRHFASNSKCPACQKVVILMDGNQPKSGKMTFKIERSPLPGYSHCGTIVIEYYFQYGIQEENHPNPGRMYTGTYRMAYLPNNSEGKEVLGLLEKAFRQRLLFTIGTSHTTGQDDCVVWNDVHHKTCRTGGPTMYGYPDPDYLRRVKEELAAKGIK